MTHHVARLRATLPGNARFVYDANMDCNLLICETGTMPAELSPEYVAAARAYARAVEAAEAKRLALLPLLLDEVRREQAPLSRIAKEAGYTPQHVARLAREAGIEPRVNRTPPRRPGAGES
jgi:hypothetical protein